MTVAYDPIIQRDGALKRANEMRLRRAEIRRRLKTGELSIVDVLVDRDECLSSMPLERLLLSVPRLGPATAQRLLWRVKLDGAKHVGSLTARQVDSVLSAMPVMRRRSR